MPSFQVVSEELTAASSLIARSDTQLATNGDAIGGTVGAAGGTPAAVVYEEFVFQVAGNADACEQAGRALRTLGQALLLAQTATQQAVAECIEYQTELTAQQGNATTATQEAQSATTQAAAATDPATARSFTALASAAQTRAAAAQQAAGAAQGNLQAAEGRGRRAYATYEQEARALSLQIAGAAGAVRPAPVIPGGTPVPITSTPGDIAIAAALARQFADGKVKGPLIDDLPPSERTPGIISALIKIEAADTSGALAAGGAKGPYGPWNASALGGDAPTVNLWVQRGLIPPMPSNWSSMSGAARQAWLRANGPYFSGLSCSSAGCTFIKATGTGTRSVPQVISTLSRWADYAAIGVCVVGSDGACSGAWKTAAAGKLAVKVFFTAPGGLTTVVAPKIEGSLLGSPTPNGAGG